MPGERPVDPCQLLFDAQALQGPQQAGVGVPHEAQATSSSTTAAPRPDHVEWRPRTREQGRARSQGLAPLCGNGRPHPSETWTTLEGNCNAAPLGSRTASYKRADTLPNIRDRPMYRTTSPARARFLSLPYTYVDSRGVTFGAPSLRSVAF